jgi:predicted acylesterase/phospholipase RssA
VVATSLSTGDPVGFVSSRQGAPSHLDDSLQYVSTRVRGEHVRASAAIPILFPAVEISVEHRGRRPAVIRACDTCALIAGRCI